jgi:hypothetical protein
MASISASNEKTVAASSIMMLPDSRPNLLRIP